MQSSSFFFSIVALLLTVVLPVQGQDTDLPSISAQALTSLLSFSNSTTTNSTITNSTTHISTTEDSVYNDDCEGAALATVGQAMSDAVTMAQAVKGVWNESQYLPILEKYMGKDCLDNTFHSDWIQSKRH